MNDYETLTSIYYKTSERELRRELKKRLSSHSTVVLPLFIKTRFNDEVPLFISVLPSFLELSEKLSESIGRRYLFNDDLNKEPYLNSYINELMVDEIRYSSLIEGIVTKREDLLSGKSNCHEKNKHWFLINKYNKIVSSTHYTLNKVEDFKEQYEALFKDESESDYKCDGKLFRKEGVDIYDRKGTMTIIDQGVYPESKIIENLEALIYFINNENYSIFLKAIVTHYILVYNHPFYDGNGRFARYITSAMLSNKDKYLALNLSKVIHENVSDNITMYKSDHIRMYNSYIIL